MSQGRSRSRSLLSQVGRQVRRRVRRSSTASVDQVIVQPQAEARRVQAASMGLRPSTAGRLSVRRMPDNVTHADRGDGVPAWVRKYGTMSWLLVGIVVALGLVVFATARIQVVFIAVFLALVLSSVLDPLVTWLSRAMPRPLAVAVALLASLLLVAGLLTYVIRSVAGQWADLAGQFADGLDQILEFLETGPLPFHISEAELYQWFDESVAQFQQYLQENAGDLAGQLLSNAGSVALVFTVLALSLFVTVFFLASGKQMWRWFLNQLPARRREKVHLAAGAGWYTFSGYARGTMLVASADGVMAFVLLSVVGVPLAAPLAVLVFIGAFIPLIGAPAAMIVAAVVALAANGLVPALIVTIGIALIGQIEGHVLQPLIMGKQVSLHPVVVGLGVTAGTFLAGLLGAVVAIPLLAVLWAVYSALHEPDPPIEGPLPPARRAAELTSSRGSGTPRG